MATMHGEEKTRREREQQMRGETQAAAASAQTAAGHLQQAGGVAVEHIKDMSRELPQKAQQEVQETKRSMKIAWRDSKDFIRKHPYLVTLLLGLTLMTGIMMAGSGFTAGWMGRSMYGNYKRSSPQYRAHEALDTVLKSYYGGGKYAESMGLGGGHRLESAYSHLMDTLSSAKDRLFGGGESRGGGGSFADYLTGARGGGGRGRGEWYGEDEDRGFMSNVADKLKYYTGTSDEAKIESAEKRLREVLRSHGRGDL